MSTVNAFIRTDKPNKRGECPIYIRITVNRISSYIPTEVKVLPLHWDSNKQRIKKGHRNANAANSLIDNKIYRCKDIIYESGKLNKILSAKEIKNSALQNNSDDLIERLKTWIKSRLDADELTFGTYSRYLSVIQKIEESFNRKLKVQDFNTKFLEDFDQYLRERYENSRNTISSNMSFLRAAANHLVAKKEMKPQDNPFISWKLAFEPAKRKYLSIDEIKLLRSVPLNPKTKIHECREVFMLCFETGFRIGDALRLKLNNFNGSHFEFTSQKTGTLTKLLASKTAKDIIKPFMEGKSQEEYIFNFLTVENQSEEQRGFREQKAATALINKNLGIIRKRAGLEKNISSHFARHSFATNALEKGLTFEQIKGMLHHKSVKTTELYAQITGTFNDESMRQLNEKA